MSKHGYVTLQLHHCVVSCPCPLYTSLTQTHCPSIDSFHKLTCRKNKKKKELRHFLGGGGGVENCFARAFSKRKVYYSRPLKAASLKYIAVCKSNTKTIHESVVTRGCCNKQTLSLWHVYVFSTNITFVSTKECSFSSAFQCIIAFKERERILILFRCLCTARKF